MAWANRQLKLEVVLGKCTKHYRLVIFKICGA
jgi:hypothetical protein